MFVFDVETVGLESTSVMLSLAMTYVDTEVSPSYQDLIDSSIFIKFDVMEQYKQLKRVMDPDTLKWWERQAGLVKEASLRPSDSDFKAKEGLELLSRWYNTIGKPNDLIFVRGSLDQMVLESLQRSVGLRPFAGYNLYRDVRTFIDCMYPKTAKNGYVDIDPTLLPDFKTTMVLKHHPVHDCAYDACMMMYGVDE